MFFRNNGIDITNQFANQAPAPVPLKVKLLGQNTLAVQQQLFPRANMPTKLQYHRPMEDNMQGFTRMGHRKSTNKPSFVQPEDRFTKNQRINLGFSPYKVN